VANVLVAFNNKADAATLSGGSYSASLPLTNLQDRAIKKVARSSNLLLASTKFVVDMGSSVIVKVLAVVGHNMSLTAKYRLRGGSDATFATYTYDSGWKDVWPAVYATYDLEWQSNNWWSGRYTEEERQGYNWNILDIMPNSVSYRYWQYEFDDAARTDGIAYLDFGRLFVSNSWSPVVNMSQGATIGWETNTQVQESLSGAEFFQYRTPYRVARFGTDFMLDNEAFSSAFDVQRRSGIDKEVYYVYDSADTIHKFRRSFLGRIRKLDNIEITNFLLRKMQWEVKELL
jgi:hypothetical protein